MPESLTNYHLLFELLHEGKGNIHPDIEPIDTEQIIKIIEKRADKTFGTNINGIIDWFMSSEGVSSDKERTGIATVIRIKNIEKRSLSKIQTQSEKWMGQHDSGP